MKPNPVPAAVNAHLEDPVLTQHMLDLLYQKRELRKSITDFLEAVPAACVCHWCHALLALWHLLDVTSDTFMHLKCFIRVWPDGQRGELSFPGAPAQAEGVAVTPEPEVSPADPVPVIKDPLYVLPPTPAANAHRGDPEAIREQRQLLRRWAGVMRDSEAWYRKHAQGTCNCAWCLGLMAVGCHVQTYVTTAQKDVPADPQRN